MNRRPAALLLALTLVVGTLAGCSDTARVRADISAYSDTPITIAGLLEEEFTVTPGELAELPCVYRSATGKTEKAGTVNATGPLLETFLAQYGFSQTDFERVRFIARDEYRVVLREDLLAEYEVVLSVASGRGKDPLPSSEQPLRLLIPDGESNMWEYAVTRIEFEHL